MIKSVIFVVMDAIRKIYRFYVDGFREMTVGKTLWAIILCKAFVLFFVLKIFFFPNLLKALPDDNAKGAYVATDLVHRVSAAPSAPQPSPSGHPKPIDNE